MSGGAATPSDWPSLNADAAQSDYNAAEKGISAKDVAKLKVRWTATLPDISYPVVAGGKVYAPALAGRAVHARVLDATTGKQVSTFSQGAIGGILVADGSVYLAGRSLVRLDASTGEQLAQIKGASKSGNATFTYPLASQKLVISGYSSDSQTIPNSLYAVEPGAGRVVWHSPSVNAQGAIAGGRVITLTGTGSVFYSLTNGRALSSQSSIFSDWFSSNSLAYTVASVKGKSASVYAYNMAGHKVWSRAVGPAMNTVGWAHAVDGKAVYVATLKPQQGLEALDAATGVILWKRALTAVQRIAVANGIVFVLTAPIGQPLQLVTLSTTTGKTITGISISGGYFAFPTANELMIANGMIFIRAIGPGSSPQLIALGKSQ